MKHFLSDRQRLPLKSLVLPPTTDGLAATVAAGGVAQVKRDGCGATAAPQVEAVKKGDKIVRLIVTCTCGERIEIDCLYPAGG